MKVIPVDTSGLDIKLAHVKPLIKGKTYTIRTARDIPGKYQIAMVLFKLTGKKREVFFKIDELVHKVKYTIEFQQTTGATSLMLTYWKYGRGKWGQLTGDGSIK